MRNSTKKITAWFFLLVFGTETFYPGAAYALTSGPAQPEFQKFEAAGVSDLVDLFTGDFKYNIPLMDVGGYPVNIAYNSGMGIEDEASWVGCGWSLNPGSINRSMRGLPDDFNGVDQITKQYHRKEFKKVGGQVIVKPSIVGWEVGSPSLKIGVYKDNYYGIGAELGASLGYQLAKNKKTSLTVGLDVNSDTRQGVTISPSMSLNTDIDMFSDVSFTGLSGNFAYNTRSGLKSVSLKASFSNTVLQQLESNGVPIKEPGVSYTRYFGQSYTPTLRNNTKNRGFTFSFDVGPSFFGGYVGIGGQGYVYREEISQPVTTAPAYGYMYHMNGRQKKEALLDFNREKDGVFLKSAPSIPVPIATQDFFMATGQAGSQQFRPYFAGNYIIFDKEYQNNSTNIGAGITAGIGNIFKGGARIDVTAGSANTGKWVNNNEYLSLAEVASGQAGNPAEEPVYFKAVGEQTLVEEDFLQKLGGEDAQGVVVNDITHPFAKAKAFQAHWTRNGVRSGLVPFKRTGRDKRVGNISFLTAKQADKYAVNPAIKYKNVQLNDNEPDAPNDPYETLARRSPVRKDDHISEITINDNGGKRMVYGLPVYNKEQHEVTFSVNGPAPGSVAAEQARRTGLITYSGSDNTMSNGNGRDNLYSKESMPGYATSFLLTNILSPDYVDVKNDGITDDDLGSAVKFDYVKANDYKWRAPYAQLTANYNEGYNSDTKDDKASYVYGVKENWYLRAIESKTMIAFFCLSDREDGLGVTDENGGKNTSVKLKKLDKIVLYSRADYLKNGLNAFPVKTVHFDYDYSLYPGVVNNSGNVIMVGSVNKNSAKGKLTLKKIYFTFGNNTRGITNPYNFDYDLRLISSIPNVTASNDPLEATDAYTTRQDDRWGTYKQSWHNPKPSGARILNNSEFPYTVQQDDDTPLDERELNSRFAAKWQLNKITTPTSSIINIQYESDDYAFVQNRRAMQMCFVRGVGSALGTSNDGMNGATGFSVNMPVDVPGGNIEKFKQMYLLGADGRLMDKLFYKIYTNIDNRPAHYDYINGYAEIDLNGCTVSSDGKTAFIPLKKVNNYNPVSRAGWQTLKSDLPQFAYDNYDNSNTESFFDDVNKAIKSLVTAAVNYRDLFVSFEENAQRKKFSNKIDLTRSMVRLYSPESAKLGGGSRVKEISISDSWFDMSIGGRTAVYGEKYEYAIKDAAGNKISSSGVAAYEPQIGNEENPFHEPINFTEKVHWSADRYHYIEKPFCESYFPAASVGYSKVTVTSFGDDYAHGAQLIAYSGYTVNEFYTARDFPTVVDNLNLQQTNYESKLTLQLFASAYIERVVTSQGFKVELNDMHGKQKSVKIYNKAGDMVSSTENFYNVENETAQEKRLNNNVDVLLGSNGNIDERLLATDVDMVTDVRESSNESIGTSIGAYGGSMIAFIIPVPYGAVNYNASYTADSYNSVSTVKVIHKYGILKKVRTIKNGSSIMAENLLWDGETGSVLLTRSQNEFDDYTYAFNYPAYMAEGQEGMGAAYKNIGAVFTAFTVGGDGAIPASYRPYLFPGDELASLDGTKKGWVIQPGANDMRFIDAEGNFITATGRYYLLRSGRRNLTSASSGSIICMKNPVVNVSGVKKMQFSADNKILDANAAMYSNEWAVRVHNKKAIVTQCIDPLIIPEIETVRNYTINETGSTQCNAFFEATTTITGSKKRSFLNFASINIPDNATIISVKLKLQPAAAQSAAAFIRRVTAQPQCESASWSNQPVVTTTNQVAVTNAGANGTEVDLIDMFYDWYNGRNSGGFEMFAIGLILGNESGGVVRTLRFYGLNGTYPETIPQLEVCYEKEEECGGSPIQEPVNPYTTGLLGNWRTQRSFVYMVNRAQNAPSTLPGATNIRKSGYYAVFNPFWNFQSGALHTSVPGNLTNPAERWVWNNKSVYYDSKGNEVESVTPINRDREGNIITEGNESNRYSAALFGYRESVATAVAVNARRNEIAFDGFEDYDFSLRRPGEEPEKCPFERHLDWGLAVQSGSWCNPAGCITNTVSHSGKYSYQISGPVNITKPGGSPVPSAALMYYSGGKAILTYNELINGFSPVNGRKYILSMWVKENNNGTNKINNLTVSINGQDQQVNTRVVPVVEDWKKLELTFTADAFFSLSLQPSGSIYIDDVRIFPYDAHLTSFVYDDHSMRVMAQLDENNFAKFYEYDDEGTLIRVKKETERGIMTLQENRQSFRKR